MKPQEFYDKLKSLLTRGRVKDKVKYCYKTWVRLEQNGDLVVTHHYTDVCTVHPDGAVSLHPDGWVSRTTSKRLNMFTQGFRDWNCAYQMNICISTRRGCRYVEAWKDGQRLGKRKLQEGDTIMPDFSVKSADEYIAHLNSQKPKKARAARAKAA